MAIVALDKLTLLGPSRDQDSILRGLQSLGCVHLVSLREDEWETPEFVSKEAREALRYLESCPTQRQQTEEWGEQDPEQLIKEVRDIKQSVEQLEIEKDGLEAAIRDLAPWGDFRLPPPEELNGARLWFYLIPVDELHELPEELVWFNVRHEGRTAYVVVISEEEPQGVPYKPLDLDSRSLSELRSRQHEVTEELERLHWDRVTLTWWRDLLRSHLDAADDDAARVAAMQGLWEDEDVMVLQGWMPRPAAGAVEEFAAANQLAIVCEPPADDDSPPTLLDNPDRLAGAEGCVTFYITPGYHAWDPTPVVYFSFSLFFGMIMSDAGYGLLLAGILAILWRKLGASRQGMRFRNLLIGIVVATIGYGVVAGSYFGVEPSPGSFLDLFRVKVDGQPLVSQQTPMMVFAVGIGVFHLAIANLISAWNVRRSWRSLGHLGWASLMIGAFLFGIGRLQERSGLIEAGQTVLVCGGIAVLLFSSERSPLTLNPITHLRRLFDGIMQVANLSKAFGDSLSYLRLFALGLASAQLAVTFNGLAADASQMGGIGILLALLILIVGHSINLLLGVMGGVVHGLRLNCIEFFNWGLTDEGYPFQPFRKKAAT